MTGTINWTEWGAIATSATVVVYLIVGAVAWYQLKEARRLRDEQARPWVIAYFEASAFDSMRIVVENIGATVAREVRVSFDPALTSTLEYFDPATIPAFADGISMLPPQQRLIFDFDSYMLREKSSLPMKFAITVAYKDAFGKKPLSTNYDLDLRSLAGSRLPAAGLPEVVKALDSLSRDLREMRRAGASTLWSGPTAPLIKPLAPQVTEGRIDWTSRLRNAVRALKDDHV